MQKAREGAVKSCLEKKKPPPPPSVSAAATNKSGKKKKNTTSASDTNSLISSSSLSTTPTSKLAERKLPEKKKRPATARVVELESHVAHLEEDLKKAKDQLRSSESGRRQALYEAEEAKKRISLMAEKLEESQQQLMHLSNSEDDRLQQLRKLSQERDRAWQSELEAVQTQKSMDSAALASAMNEIKKLRLQLGRAAAESAHDHDVRMELSETLNLVETLRNELGDRRESEAQAMELVRNTEKQLEIANVTADTLRSELERLRDQIKDQPINSSSNSNDDDEQLREELKVEASKLRCALEAAETRYQEEYIQSTLQIRSAYEQVEQVKQESSQRQTAMEDELKVATSRIEQLMSKDSKVGEEMEKLRLDLSEMKESLRDKETKLQMLSEENKALREEEIRRAAAVAAALAEGGGGGNESNKTETHQELEAANSELKRLKVQSEQWRKAAEVATSMLSSTTATGKLVGSLDNSYYSSTKSSPSIQDMEDESPKKINMMMLKKIGVLWKKGQNNNIK